MFLKFPLKQVETLVSSSLFCVTSVLSKIPNNPVFFIKFYLNVLGNNLSKDSWSKCEQVLNVKISFK